MNDNIPFEYLGQEVRTILKDGEPWFVAKDICDILGIQEASTAMDELDDDEKGLVRVTNPENPTRFLEVSAVNEPGLYQLIIASNRPGAKSFRRWITHEVIPAIRRHGAYLTPQKIDEVLSDPDTLIHLATTLKEEREKNRRLFLENLQKEQIVNELQPKATYYDLVLHSKSLLTVSQIAKDYGLSAKALNNILREEKVQFKHGGRWFLYQKYAKNGYTQSRSYALASGHITFHTYWTQKGRLFIYDLLKNKRGILPVIERSDAL